MGHRTTCLAVAALLAISTGATARDAAIEMLLPGERVSSTLSAAGERKLIAFAGVEGTKLSVGVGGPPGGRVAPRLSILAPDGTIVASAGTTRRSPHRARITGLTLTATGVWRIVVEAPARSGGAFTLATSARVPSKFAWTGTLAPATPFSNHAAPAAPGGRISVVVKMSDGSTTTPVVELIAPSGAVVATKTVVRRGAVVATAATVELGVYAVRVSGGDGGFSAAAVVSRVRRPRPRFRDVESAPDIVSFGPSPSENQLVLTLFLAGVGFADGQTASILDGTRTLAKGQVRRYSELGASAVVDLADVAPGAYSLVISSAGGNAAVARTPFVVVNREPRVSFVDPIEAPNVGPFPLSVRGGGFDAEAELVLRRSSDGAAVPVSIVARVGHESVAATASPTPYVTGRFDVEVRDPGGGKSIVAGGVDLLGFRGAPTPVRSFTGVDAPNFIVCAAAYDDARGRVMLAIRERTSRAVFALFDSATSAVVDTLVIEAQDVGMAAIDQADVAFDPVGGTFALCVCSQLQPARGHVRVVSATDVRHVLGQTDLGIGTLSMTNVCVAPERGVGGYLVAWHQFDATYGARILAQAVTVAGGIDVATRATVAWDAYGNAGYPAVAFQGDGRFIVAWAGLTDDYRAYAFRATVTDAMGTQVAGAGPYVAATSTTWSGVAATRLAVDPVDGSALLAFSYSDGIVLRPAAQRLAALTAAPGGYFTTLDTGLAFPGGRLTGLAWSPARAEFVAAVGTFDGRVVLRRVNPDGSLRAASIVESYEGAYGVVYAGAAADSPGFARAFDGVADGSLDEASPTMHALAGPLR